MKPPLEIEPHTPRVGPENRPAPVLEKNRSKRTLAAAVQPARVDPPAHEQTRRKLENLIESGARPDNTTVLVATLSRDVLAEERPFQPFLDALATLGRFGGWEYSFYLYCVRRRATTLLQNLPPSARTAEIKAVQTWAAELDHDGGGD